jgi:hypothetical protein
VLGVVKPDNTTITISGGTISAVGSAATIVVNSSPITAGTTGHVAYDNAGTFGEAANFLISSGNPNVTLTHAYLYNNQNAIFAVPPSGAFTTLPNSWFFGDAGNFTVSGDSNFCEGPGAGASLTTGHWNMVEGTEGLNSGTTATSNLVFGRRAAFSLIDGTDNVWAGTGAGQNATTGCSFNVAIGTGAMGSGALVGAVSNVAIGNVALSNLAGASGRNVAIGTGSAQTATAMNSGIMVGMNAGQAITAANNNILIGDTAAAVLSTGGYNICIGHLAASKLTGGFNTLIGAVVANTTLTSGSQNIIIGTQCDVPSASASGQISIGNQIYGTNCTSTGATVGTGQIGIGISGPTAFLHVAAATTAQSAISLTPSAGVSPSSPNNGDLWNDGTHLYFRHGGVSTDLLAGGGGGVTSGTMTANAAVYATGAGSIASTAALTNGQILIGSTGVAPVAATIATSGSGISVTNGAGTITLANTGVTSAVAGTGISVSGATGAVTIGLVTPVTVANGGSGAATFAAHGLLLGEGASAFGVTAVGTTNQILIGQSAADPIWATTLPTAALPAFTGDVTSPAASTVNTLASIITAGGPTGSATTVPIITWDAKGRLTVVSSAAIAIAAGSVSGLAAVATSGSATDLTTGTLPSGRFGPLTGDVTTSGYVATLANIPTGTPAVGTILHTNIAAPSAPAAGKIAVYTNTTNNILSAMNSGGTVSNTVVADTGAANNFLTAISAGGVISKAQPSFSNLSGSLASTQTPAYTGDVTSSAGATVNTLASIITAGGPTGNATTVPVITYDAKGRLTAVTTATIAAGTANVDPSPQRVVAVNAGSTTMTGWNLILDPAGLLTTYAITMPASPSNGQIAVIRSSQPISGLSFTAPGTTLVAAPNTLAAGSRLEAIYISAVTSWYFGL